NALMGRYIVQRLLLSIPTIIGLSLVVFLLIRLAIPYDLIDVLLADSATSDPKLRETLEKDLGVGESLPRQYASWMFSVLRGDLGESLHSRRSITDELS